MGAELQFLDILCIGFWWWTVAAWLVVPFTLMLLAWSKPWEKDGNGEAF